MYCHLFICSSPKLESETHCLHSGGTYPCLYYERHESIFLKIIKTVGHFEFSQPINT